MAVHFPKEMLGVTSSSLPLYFVFFFFCSFIPFIRCTRMVADSRKHRLHQSKWLPTAFLSDVKGLKWWSSLTYMLNRKLMGESTGSQGKYHIPTSVKKRKADRCKLDVNGTFWIYTQIKQITIFFFWMKLLAQWADDNRRRYWVCFAWRWTKDR